MSAAPQRPKFSTAPWAAAIGGVAGVLALAWGFAEPRDGLQGWLIAFVTVAGACFGAFALLCVNRLLAGRWGEVAGPALKLAAGALPILILAWLPIAVGTATLLPGPRIRAVRARASRRGI